MTIAEIDERRRAAGISQKDICAAAGIDVSTYSQIKLGHRGALNATIVKLSAALDRLVAERKAA
jgi:transcriptional regulator with XRE-family HTH domain